MYIAIIDDSIDECSNTAVLVQNVCKELNIQLCKLDIYESAEHYLKYCGENKYDLIILDIFMNQLTGIELAYKIRESDQNVRLVFASSSNDFACESYCVNASYYIQKPVTQKKIMKMMNRIQVAVGDDYAFLTLPSKQKILVRNIVYAEYRDHTMTINCTDGKAITVRMAFHKFIDLISHFPFFVICNKGTVVNMYEIDSIEKYILKTSSGKLLNISRRRVAVVNTQYQEFLFSVARKELSI